MSDLGDHVRGIKGWLSKQGYPLEMLVARTMHRQGMGFAQSWHYEDPDTSEAREIDILASSYAYGDSTLLLQAIIECKHSQQPFVAFTYESVLRSPMEFWVPCNPRGHTIIRRIMAEQRFNEIPVFSQQHTVAYNLKHVYQDDATKKGRRDIAFEAVMSVVKASYALSNTYTNKVTTLRSKEGAEQKPASYIGLPTIVVAAPLFVCHLDVHDKLAVEPRSSLLLEWTYPKVGLMYVRVMQEDYVATLARDIVRSAEILSGPMQAYI